MLRKRRIVDVFDVFTPTTQAKLNFVARDARLERTLADALLTPGKQIVVYGESGSGKSTLLLKALSEWSASRGFITTRCISTTTFDQLLLDAFDQLNHFYQDTTGSASSKGISPTLGASFLSLRASIDATSSASQKRVVPPQLTPQRLGEFLGAQGLCWVIEDFHKMELSQKRPLEDSLKVFCDLSRDFKTLKVICVGATATAREVVTLRGDVSERASQLLVPLMTTDELNAIIHGGERLLNIDMSALSPDIVQYAVGVASACHQICLNACLEKGIQRRGRKRATMERSDLSPAILRYVTEASDSLKEVFEAALVQHRVRQFDNCRLILTALAEGPLEGMLHAEILASIRRRKKDYPSGNLTTYLQSLTEEARGSVLRKGQDGKYRFNDPLYHTFAQVTLVQTKPARKQADLQVLIYEDLLKYATINLSSEYEIKAFDLP